MTLHTRWVERLRRRERPSGEELRDHLLAVHRLNAGFTEQCASVSRDDRGRNSYEWLAELVDPARHGVVLDLACGSGLLMDLCRRRCGEGVRLIGVDMSEDELALARARLPGGTMAELHHGLAQELPFVEDASVDVVLCHWALTLMDPVEPVLREVQRVLRPGGVFAAIVDGDMAQEPAYERLHHLIYELVCEEYPGYGEFDMGDARVRTTEALAALTRQCFRAEDQVLIEPGLVHLQDAPARLARISSGFFYASFVLAPQARARMLARLEEVFAAGAAQQPGGARFSMPINRLLVRKASASGARADGARRRLAG